MTARILVVDDIAINVRLLEAKLSVEYYDVVGAADRDSSGASWAGKRLSGIITHLTSVPKKSRFKILGGGFS